MSVEAETIMDSIYNRLQQSKGLSGVISPINPIKDQMFVKSLDERIGISKLARTDELVTQTDLLRLNLKAEELRNGIFKVGLPFNQDPLYREWLREDIIDESQAQRLFFIRDGNFQMKAELDPNDYGSGFKFAITVRESNRVIDLGIDFLNGYWLSMEFGDPREDSYAEYHAYEELSSMTSDEYQIFSHFLNKGRKIIDEKS